jgi:hypothetical protein
MSERRAEFTQAIKVRRLTFAGFRCEAEVTRDDATKVRCNAVLTGKRVEFHHAIEAELGGLATFENCRAWCRQCHRDYYPQSAAKISEAKRREAAHVGARRPKQRMASGAKLAGPERAHEGRQPLPRRSLYEDVR